MLIVLVGLLMDSARHYKSIATLKQTIDAMAHMKLNVLHLHITDDEVLFAATPIASYSSSHL